MYKKEKKVIVNRSLLKMESELVDQGLISDRSEPRELYRDYPSPHVNVRKLVDRIKVLEKQVSSLLPNVKALTSAT